MPSGLFALKTPSDLLAKLRYDYQRLANESTDQYAAFDFFVTAEHLIDWLHPNSETERKSMRSSSALLRLCSHIANGSKHFQATAKHHKSFSKSEVHHGAFSSDFSSDFDISGLILTLDGQAKMEFGAQVYAHDLAKQVLTFWEKKLDTHK
jgi:hypothetical protein